MSTPTESIAGRIVRPVVQAAVAFTMVISGLLMAPEPAQAAYNGSCRGAVFGLLSQEICVTADMGSKDHRTKREYIRWVEAKADAPATLEVWGDGFYHKGRGSSRYWHINRWLRSGTNVCAAATDAHGVRSIACFAIRV
jgi:hypothetical protein